MTRRSTLLLAAGLALLTTSHVLAAPPQPAPVARLATTQPDADHDGVPDRIELVLGMDPKHPDVLHHIFHDKTIAEGDYVHAQRKVVPDITDLYSGNVAKNRWVWRIDFADTFEGAGANLLFYIDADNDPKTGRQAGAQGTDVRLVHQDGGFSTVIQNAAVLGRDRTLRGIADGRSLYLCMDLNLQVDAAGYSRFRSHALCQMSADARDSDATGFFPVVGPRMQDKPKLPSGVLSQALSDDALVQKPWLGWRDDLRAAKPVMLEHVDGKTQGMKPFNRALEPVADHAKVAWTAPAAGRYHVNVLIQDSAIGNEQVLVKVDGKRFARFVAGQNDGDLYLFTTRETVEFRLGSTLTLEAVAPAQDFRLSEVFLTRRPVRPGPVKLTHLAAYCPPQAGDKVSVDVCFLTDYACRGSIRWGAGKALTNVATDERATYNHRIRLQGLTRGATYSVRALASDGESTVHTDLTFVADQKRPARCGVARKQIALSINDAWDGQRPMWPINGGVPIARGELSSSANCRLLTAAGLPVAAQFGELAHWPDGSVKWVLVTVVNPAGTEGYTLEYGSEVVPPPIPADGIRVAETEDGLRITTDRLQVDLSRTHFSPPGVVWVDANRDGRFSGAEQVVAQGEGLVLVDAQERRYTSTGAPATRLEIEEAGPVRTVVVAEGPLTGAAGKRLSYRCRLYFYRGFAAVPTVVSLLVDEGKTIFPPTMHRIKSFTLPVKLAATTQGERGRWLQDDDNRYVVSGTKRAGTYQGELPNARSVGVGQTQVTIAVKDFWQLYPKAFAFDGQTFTAELFPELPPDQYAEHTDPKLLTINYYWYQKGAYLVPCGMQPSTDLLFSFERGEPEAAGNAWQHAVLLAASPEHVCDSKAFGELEPEKAGVFDVFQSFVRDGLRKIDGRRRNQRWYSWMNYGDTYGERGVNWTNQEYDMQWGLLLQYARSGDMRFFDRGLSAARHTAGIDQITWSPEPARMGIQKEHALWHVGGFGTPRIEGAKYWFQNGIYNTGHMWTQGTYAAYCLTGDRRLKDAIDCLPEWMAGQYCRYLERWVHRNYGWATMVVLGAYHTEPDPYYLNAARLFMKYVVSRQDPGTGGFIHPIGECEHRPRHMGGKTFMSGVEMTALRMIDAIEPSDEYKRAITNTCDWMHARMWHPEANGFQYAQCTQYDKKPGSTGVTMSCEGMAYAYEFSKKAEYKEMLLRSLARMVKPGGGSSSGKGYATQLRMLPFAFAIMERLGLAELPAPPPQPPKLGMAGEIYLAPGVPATLALVATNSAQRFLDASASVVEIPKGITAAPMQIKWRMMPGTSASPAIRITGTAVDGAVVKVRYSAGEWSGVLSAVVRRGEALKLDSIGYVGWADDPVGKALGAMGIELPRLPDLEPKTLASYRALLVGSEAHEKRAAGLPANAKRLLDFVHAGGRVAFAQIQDSSFKASYLPYPLTLSNDKGALGKIAAPTHPIFTTPGKVKSLAGLVSYDTIVAADPAWRVLATDTKGRPSIVEATFGKGSVLLVQPSPDRYVIGQESGQGALTASACSRLLRNIVAYLQAER
jgi:hypothetical protein